MLVIQVVIIIQAYLKTLAWQTVSKVNSTEFVPGDVIHFKSGDVWKRATGTL